MTHSPWAPRALLGIGLILLPAAPVFAAAKHASSPAKPASVVEPQSVQALGAMAAYLRSLTAFELQSKTIREDIDDSGQKLQFTGMTTYKVRRPNGLMIEVAEDRRVRQVFYDGHSLTVYSPRMGFYAHVPAPATIRETLTQAADRYDIHLPLEDLFKWGAGDDGSEDLKSGYRVGYAKIDGQDTDQYAFRQAGVDWQIWIARGDKPVPLRVVVTTTDEPGAPQFEAELTWNLAPQFTDATFAFQAPQEAKPIGIAAVQ